MSEGPAPEATGAEQRESLLLLLAAYHRLLRLPATMQTEAGRREADRRVAFMETFLANLALEIGGMSD